MSGYRRKPKTYNLSFAEDHEFHGLEVTMRGLSLGKFLQVQAWSLGDEQQAPELLEIFASRLVSWNLEEEDGTPIPPTLEAVQDQDLEFVVAVLSAWVDAIAGVSDPLEKPSPDGKLSPALPIPMDVLSPSLPSSQALNSSSAFAANSTFSPVPS